MSKYDLSTLREQLDTLPNIRIEYETGETGETGWACSLGPALAFIANVPYTARLHVMDVVELVPGPWPGRLRAGRVVWRGYEKKAAFRYEGGAASYLALYEACKELGLMIEGVTEGTAVLCHHEDTDLHALAERTGVALIDWAEIGRPS